MLLRAGYFNLALSLQEASDAMSASEIRDGLQNAVRAAHRGDSTHDNHYHSYVDHTGDEDSGEVIYTCDPDNDGDCDYMAAPYEKGTDTSDSDYTINRDQARQVAMRSSWEDVGDEADHYAAMEAARLYTKGPVPIFERFVSKKERAGMDSSDFAGKGKSFPINKPGDVAAAFHSLGRAGSDNYSVATIRANIIRIAKRKGFPLPKSAQDDTDSSESQRATSSGMRLVESAATIEPIILREARADYEIKLIAPGKGSSAFYPAEVLKRDGPKVFGVGTHVYVNHPTQAEEAQRPEGDVKNLAGVLTTAAAYHESHAKGPGLYARMKVFADHGQMVEEKAPHVGMSIRASGIAEAGRKHEGVPILKELTSAESVDVVTRAGAGGMILTEAARSANSEGGGMTTDEAKKLIEAAVRPYQTRFLREDARAEAAKLLETVALPQAAKTRITERAIANVPETADGGLDLTKFRETVVAEAQSEGQYLAQITGSGKVFGMGAGFTPQVAPKPEEIAAREAEDKRDFEEQVSVLERLGLPRAAAIKTAQQGRAA